MGDPQAEGFVDRIYEAALEQDLWLQLIEDFVDLLGATSAALIPRGDGDGLWTRSAPEVRSEFYTRFHMSNPLQDSVDRIRSQPRYRPGVLSNQDLIDTPELLRSDYFNAFLRPNGLESLVIIDLGKSRSSGASLDIGRAGGRDFSDEEISLCRALQPHFVRSFNLGVRLGGTRRPQGPLTDNLERSPHAVMLIGEDARITFANPTADAMFADGAQLTAKAGRLAAATPQATRALQALIGAAVSPDPALRTGGTMALPPLDGAIPMVVMAAPLRSERTGLFGASPRAIICVAALGERTGGMEAGLRELFGLTAQEAELARRLLDGLSLDEAAAELNLGYRTSRSHLERILDKTQTSRPDELVRLTTGSATIALG